MDALIVLGCLIGEDGYTGRVARFRMSHALRLAVEQYPHSCLILSGGQQPGTPTSEARALAAWGLTWAESEWNNQIRQRLAARLLYEESSLTTKQSARNTALLLREKGLTQAGLVTDSLHIYRAAYLFTRHFADHQLRLHPLPVPGLFTDYWRRRRYARLAKLVLREGGAWVKLLGQQLLSRGPV